uniref:Secreted protein n=2 Tax=Triticum TaxID=4564 RepID=A0A8R7QDK1_TRIUA
MGVALLVCTLPGQVTSDCLGPEKIELGLGIVKPLSVVCPESFLHMFQTNQGNYFLKGQKGQASRPRRAAAGMELVKATHFHGRV